MPKKKTLSTNREERVTIRLTAPEVRVMEAAAREMGVSISTWIRVTAIAALRARKAT